MPNPCPRGAPNRLPTPCPPGRPPPSRPADAGCPGRAGEARGRARGSRKCTAAPAAGPRGGGRMRAGPRARRESPARSRTASEPQRRRHTTLPAPPPPATPAEGGRARGTRYISPPRRSRRSGGLSYLPGLAAVGEGVDPLCADVHGAPVDAAEGSGRGAAPGAVPRRRRRRHHHPEQDAEQSPGDRGRPPGHRLVPAATGPAGQPHAGRPAARCGTRTVSPRQGGRRGALFAI